jgi:hypothetical protein
MTLNEVLASLIQSGFITDYSITPYSKDFIVQKGRNEYHIQQSMRRLFIGHDGVIKVYNNVSENLAPVIITRALSSSKYEPMDLSDFTDEEGNVSYDNPKAKKKREDAEKKGIDKFRKDHGLPSLDSYPDNLNNSVDFSDYFSFLPYPKVFVNSTIVPVKVVKGGLVFTDNPHPAFDGDKVTSTRYIFNGDAKVGLLLFNKLYQSNREWELLTLPEVTPYDGSMYVCTSGIIDDLTAEQALQVLYSVDVAKDIPIRSKVQNILGVPEQTYTFEEVLSDRDAIFSANSVKGIDPADRTVKWSEIQKRYDLPFDAYLYNSIQFMCAI